MKPLSGSDERARHILKVLHKKTGDSFSAGIINGKEGNARITKIGAPGEAGENAAGSIYFEFEPQRDCKPLSSLTLICGFARPAQLRRLLRDVSGLGVKKLILCGTELSEKSYMCSSVANENYAKKLLIEGAEQAGSASIPKIVIYRSLKDALGSVKEKQVQPQRSRRRAHLPPGDCVERIALDNKVAQCSLHDFLYKAGGFKSEAVAAIGSERGWTDKERQMLLSAGFTLCSFGGRVLRTETAATAVCAVILDATGFLN